MDRVDTTCAEVPVQMAFAHNITCEHMWVVLLDKTEAQEACAANVRVHNTTVECDSLVPCAAHWCDSHSSQFGRCGVCGCYIIPCTWSTATLGTVRISYVNHTSGAVMVCRRVSTYAHTRVCICVGVTVHHKFVSVTHWSLVQHIGTVFYKHLQDREMATLCSIHHWCG